MSPLLFPCQGSAHAFQNGEVVSASTCGMFEPESKVKAGGYQGAASVHIPGAGSAWTTMEKIVSDLQWNRSLEKPASQPPITPRTCFTSTLCSLLLSSTSILSIGSCFPCAHFSQTVQILNAQGCIRQLPGRAGRGAGNQPLQHGHAWPVSVHQHPGRGQWAGIGQRELVSVYISPYSTALLV